MDSDLEAEVREAQEQKLDHILASERGGSGTKDDSWISNGDGTFTKDGTKRK
jgi:hypothetical protein